jgi:crotonobetainyl-CoA:carnitine CoA-transferase CaiB-like acyl-CoA transferase
MRAIELEHVYDDPRFSDMPYVFPTEEERVRVLNEVRARLKEKTATEWMRIFDEDGNVGAEPFITTQEAMGHPQFLYNGNVINVRDPELGETKQIAPLASMSATPSSVPGPAPRLGEHTEQLLARVNAGQSAWAAGESHQAHAHARMPMYPLEAITVLELGNHIAGPFGATLLAEMGARVIKVEPPEGDLLRRIVDAAVKTIQGKESIAVDLKTESGKEILNKLVRKADVLVHNFRPGVAERLGIDFGTLSQLNPTLVYVYAAAYGSGGPNVHRPAFAPAINAITGAGLYMNGEGNPPQSAIHADPSSALGVATTALMGLHAREASGRGQYIETSMICSAAYALSDDFIQYDGKPARRLPDNGQHGFDALYRLYETREGWLFLCCRRQQEWEAFCHAVGQDHLLADARFSSEMARSKNDEALVAVIRDVFGSRTATDWEEVLLTKGVAGVRADGLKFKEFFVTDASIAENGFIARAQYVDFFVGSDDYVDFGEYWRHGNTVLFSTMSGKTGPPCGIGDHTESIMLGLGYSQEEIGALKRQGVVIWGLGWAAHG